MWMTTHKIIIIVIIIIIKYINRVLKIKGCDRWIVAAR